MIKVKEQSKVVRKSYPCVHCGWAMGEREGEPLCPHCKKKKRSKNEIRS
jgi:rubrerythrin